MFSLKFFPSVNITRWKPISTQKTYHGIDFNFKPSANQFPTFAPSRTIINDFLKERVLRKRTGKQVDKIEEEYYTHKEEEIAVEKAKKAGNLSPIEALFEDRFQKHIDEKWKFQPYIPTPRYGITVKTFLERIGNDCAQYTDKFKDWADLMSSTREKLKREKEIPVTHRRWILVWVGKYKNGYEPVPVKFRSMSNKNKSKRRELLLKHLERQKKIKESIEKENAKYRKRIKNRLTRAQKDETRQAIADRIKVVHMIEEEEAKKKGILVSELRAQKKLQREREEKQRQRERQILEGTAPVVAKKAPAKAPADKKPPAGDKGGAKPKK